MDEFSQIYLLTPCYLVYMYFGSALLSIALQMDNYQRFNVMNRHYLGGRERR